MTHPIDPKIFVSAYKEEPDSQTSRTILIERVMRLRPMALDWELLAGFEWICEQHDSCIKGGPDLHRFFVEMNDQQMRATVKTTISAFRLAVSRARDLDELEENHGERFFRLMRTLLYLQARGNITINDDDVPNFVKPTGQPPNLEMQEKILDRIRHDHPMHIAVAHDLIDEVKLEPSTKGDPVQ